MVVALVCYGCRFVKSNTRDERYHIGAFRPHIDSSLSGFRCSNNISFAEGDKKMSDVYSNALLIIFSLTGITFLQLVGGPVMRYARNAFAHRSFDSLEREFPQYTFMGRGLAPHTKKHMEG